METSGAPRRLRGATSWLLGQATTHAARLVSEALGAVGARRYHYSLLAALDEFGPASQAELGRRGGLDRSDVVATVNELAEKGAVERHPDPDDKRRNIVTITPSGVAHLRHLDRVVGQAQETLLAPLSAAEREELVRVLNVVLEHQG
ncbi:MarR family winged helix-turn-helix transcriptional regulator [Saccharothrix luteola]|uniref:MarR family winged helix-turn-helix transcriptional regulator n=1 Tax=Saccharothrix luteola TaxID=2893018 RepID=UPI001E654AC7|nr:MarR family transcriptional regulator [Saccharothrix luteola]MCC8248347.1 MarR family transcriptional regulator [Saccharothrix luteola]